MWLRRWDICCRCQNASCIKIWSGLKTLWWLLQCRTYVIVVLKAVRYVGFKVLEVLGVCHLSSLDIFSFLLSVGYLLAIVISAEFHFHSPM